MHSFNTNTDWVRNKSNSQAIVYHHLDGEDEIITLDRFLADSPTNTAEMFALLKAESDAIFEAEDNVERELGENELPLFDWSEKCATPSLEEELFGDGGVDGHQAYLQRREQLLALLPLIEDKLTPVQLRRLLLHRMDGLTMREIAEAEGCSHQSVVECLQGADKKIKKFLAKS